MRRFTIVCCLAVLSYGSLAPMPSARGDDRSAEQILKDIEAIKPPAFDPSQRDDRAAVQAYIAEQQKVMSKRAELIGDLYKVAPEHEQLAKLLPQRWMSILNTGPAKAKELETELDELQAKSKNPALKADAAYWKAVIALRMGGRDTDKIIKAVDAFRSLAPKDERAPGMLVYLAQISEDSAKQTALLEDVIKSYPESQAAKGAEGTLKKLSAVGKPFELEFTEATKGTEISMKALKGKVVVIDFWATWCGPCVAEMPNMKKLYAEYRDKGVEFIGVSLDQPKDKGGLDALKDFVAKNDIAWPQYYQGNYWQSEFSMSWGINSIPAVFIIDADGKIADVNARGRLDKLIPDLLEKAKKGNAAAGGN